MCIRDSYWSEAEVDERLHQIMKDIHTQCVEYGKEPDGYINYCLLYTSDDCVLSSMWSIALTF